MAEASALAAESDVAAESGEAANAAELEVMRIKAVATHEAVGAVENLGIRITPQKLKKANRGRLLGQFQLARLRFQLEAGGPRLRG
jgi:hypothetical protein